MIEVNLNDTVWIQLTDRGRAYLKSKKLQEAFPLEKIYKPKEDEDGWSKWQLWTLFSRFGSITNIGFGVPFKTTIRIDNG